MIQGGLMPLFLLHKITPMFEIEGQSDEYCLFIVNRFGKLRHIDTPFQVRVITENNHLPLFCLVLVEQVKLDSEQVLLYQVLSFWLPYHYFQINIV